MERRRYEGVLYGTGQDRTEGRIGPLGRGARAGITSRGQEVLASMMILKLPSGVALNRNFLLPLPTTVCASLMRSSCSHPSRFTLISLHLLLRLSGSYAISQVLIGMPGRRHCSSAALLISNHDNITVFVLLLNILGGFSISENDPLFSSSRGRRTADTQERAAPPPSAFQTTRHYNVPVPVDILLTLTFS